MIDWKLTFVLFLAVYPVIMGICSIMIASSGKKFLWFKIAYAFVTRARVVKFTDFMGNISYSIERNGVVYDYDFYFFYKINPIMWISKEENHGTEIKLLPGGKTGDIVQMHWEYVF